MRFITPCIDFQTDNTLHTSYYEKFADGTVKCIDEELISSQKMLEENNVYTIEIPFYIDETILA
ncbi:hypothetical protein, partial [Bacteroides sp. 214]|uniref:hypothetical protein n=1 Tax=Bacteroides sp. 214 TaxID=2302935 RepID=UPI0013D67268